MNLPHRSLLIYFCCFLFLSLAYHTVALANDISTRNTLTKAKPSFGFGAMAGFLAEGWSFYVLGIEKEVQLTVGITARGIWPTVDEKYVNRDIFSLCFVGYRFFKDPMPIETRQGFFPFLGSGVAAVLHEVDEDYLKRHTEDNNSTDNTAFYGGIGFVGGAQYFFTPNISLIGHLGLVYWNYDEVKKNLKVDLDYPPVEFAIGAAFYL